jgi:tetratricopeptide (TPR) repeat protein
MVDQRTDIYALGLTLYELLTLRPAFDGRDHHELLRQIAQDEPTPPRRLSPAIPRDLETIVMKAIGKEPASRYLTAQELADDLTRFCDDRPILARRPNLLERGVRWARRHKQIVITATTVLVLALIVGEVVVTSKTSAISRERLDYIRASFPLIDEMTINRMGQVSAMAIPTEPGSGQMDPAIDVYRKALKLYEQVSNIPLTDPESRAIVARAYHRMGFTRGVWSYRKAMDPSLLTQAEKNYRESVKRFEGLLAERPGDPEVRSWYADALGEWGLGLFLLTTQRMAEAEPHYRHAIQLSRDLALDPGVDQAIRSDELEKMQRLTVTLAGLLDAQKHTEEAKALSRDLIETYTILAARPNGPSANTLNNLAWLLAKFPDNQPHDYARALETARKAVTLEPRNWSFWNTLGVAAYRVGDWKEAAEALEKSMSLHKGGDANDWFFLAMTRWKQNQPAEARKWYDQASAWTKQNQPQNLDELQRFQAEAKTLMGLDNPPAGSKLPAKG